MKNTKKIQKTKLSHRLAAAMTVGLMSGMASTSAFAIGGAADFEGLTTSVTTASDNFMNLMNLFGYVGGAGMGLFGIMKLKAHVDNPTQTPLKDGLMRLAAGGALLSLPIIVRTIQGSISEGGTTGTAMSAVGSATDAF